MISSTFWFVLRNKLHAHLMAITNRLTHETLNSDGSDADVVQENIPPFGGRFTSDE